MRHALPKRCHFAAQRFVGVGQLLKIRRHRLHLGKSIGHLATQPAHGTLAVGPPEALILGVVLLSIPLLELCPFLCCQRSASRRCIV